MLEFLAVNYGSAAVRRETLDGREYLVAPLSMIVPGVLNGSKGRLFYPLDEISRNHDSWNGMPMVVNHPVDKKGQPCSARHPSILEKYGVGTVFNSEINGKLSAEGWFDVVKGNYLIPEQMRKIERGEPIELSTGLFTDNEPVKNGKTDDGKEYDAIARNYRPDHLAILPDKVGACSVKDGCGVNVNEQGDPKDDDCKDWDKGGTSGQKSKVSNEEPTESQLSRYVDWDEESMTVTNQLSHRDLRDQLSKLVRDRYGSNAEIVDVFDKNVVYANYGNGPIDSQAKHYSIGYSTDLRTGKVVLSDQGTKEVVRETTYKTVTSNDDKPKQWWELISNSLTSNACASCGPKCGCDDCKEKHGTENEDEEYPVENWASLVGNAKRPSKSLDMTPAKACQILKDGSVHGNPLTPKQRGMFGALCDTKSK